jgi:hypothetical protein
MPWYKCTVNQVGPASDASDTSPPEILINLTGTPTEENPTAKAFTNTWFFAADGIQDQVLNIGIAAILSGQHVTAGAIAPNPGNQPFTEIQRLYGGVYGAPPGPPAAPTDLNGQLQPDGGISGKDASIRLTWADNSTNEEGFIVKYSGKLPESPNDMGQILVPANTTEAFFSLPPPHHGYTYEIYVVAFNSFGQSAPSNTITVSVPTLNLPPGPPMLFAAAEPAPSDPSNFKLFIEGYNFFPGTTATVQVVVDWMVGREDQGSSQSDVGTDKLGYFQTWFPWDDTFLCPNSGSQMFHVTATAVNGVAPMPITVGFTCH